MLIIYECRTRMEQMTMYILRNIGFRPNRFLNALPLCNCVYLYVCPSLHMFMSVGQQTSDVWIASRRNFEIKLNHNNEL